MKNYKYISLLAIGFSLTSQTAAFSQSQSESSTVQTDNFVVIEPLFEYPTPPESLENLGERSDYVMEHFWDKLDVKSKNTVDQNALNHAFDTYATAMQWADANIVYSSTDALIKRLEKNPVLLLQMARAAEETLYGPRASMWIDDVYIKYAKAVSRNKKIDSNRKLRYNRQIKMLESSSVGKDAPEFDFTRPDGRPGKYFPMSTPTLIYFGDPDCFDCRMGKLKMETDLDFADLVKDGRLNVIYIIADPESGWENKVADYNPKWAVGAATDIDEIYDLRLTPSIFLIDSKGKIKAKNISPDQAIRIAKDMVNNPEQ